MKIRLFLLSLLSFFLITLPAEAGRLLNWRFEPSQNRLSFTTDARVQPTAQLIPNPTRLVIDLPGTTLGQATVNRSYGGLIRSIRLGQFDRQTARIVIELQSGYTFDPQKIAFRGASPTQWTVDLPTPIPITNNIPTPPPDNQLPSDLQEVPDNTQVEQIPDFQITDTGFTVNIEGSNSSKIDITRSSDRKQIIFTLDGVTFPNSLLNQTLPVNRYGVSQIQFSPVANKPNQGKIILSVSPDSPNWKGFYSRLGGLVLYPDGGIPRNQQQGNTPPPTSPTATIQSVTLSGNQLLIRSNRSIRASGVMGADGLYQVTIPNSQLANEIQGPQLGSNSPISRVRVRQSSNQSVIILIQPNNGVQINELNQPNETTVALQFQNNRNTNDSTYVVVPPPDRNTPPPVNPVNPNNGRLLVIIDPGHGGKDVGAIGVGGVREKDIILAISLEVTRLLQQQGINVKMTRDSDYFVDLAPRTTMANQMGADLFVSIHANAINLSRPDVNGLETYYFSDPELAQTIHRNITQQIPTIQDRGVRRARFYVLRNSRMPSTLVEVGFVTGREDAMNLQDPDYQRRMAQSITSGILEYIRQNRL